MKTKSTRGRPPLHEDARVIVVQVKFSKVEHDAITKAVAKRNSDGERGTTVTISSYLRDHAIGPLGLAHARKRREEWLRVVNGLRTPEFRAHDVSTVLSTGDPLELSIRVDRRTLAIVAWAPSTGFLVSGIDPDASGDVVIAHVRRLVGLA